MIKTTATKNNELSKNFFLSYLSFFILIFISILIIAFVSFFSAKSTLTNLGETALKNKIQMGLAMMDSLETEVKKGKIKREEAQEIFRVKMLNSKQADGKTRGNNKKLELDIKAYMYAINSNGVEVMHPFKEGEDVSGLRDSEGRNLTKLIIEEGKNPKNDGIVNFEWKNPNEVMKKPKINVVGYFEPWDWHINVGCYKQDFYKSAYKMLSLILLISIVILLVSFIILRNLMVKKVNPLSEIVNSMENVSKGQLNLNLDINRKDEIGYIANVFNKMVEDIKDILINIKGISTTLQEKANNIDSSSDGTLDNSNNIKEAMEQISESINNTSKEIENSFENIKELSNNIMSIKENSITMKNKMEQASNLNNNIVNVLNELENKNSENIEVSKETNYNIKTLLEKSNTIVGIVSTIDEISDQINLLALNASIESARAGQAGKGFAVVAEEIKNLSNETSEAVKKISELINELISVINLSVESVGRAGDVAESQVEIINETRSTLMNVSDFIEKMPKIIQNNVDKIEEAYEKQEKINSSMASVIAVSEEISASSEEITSSTGEVNNNINSIKNLSEELSVFSEELNNKINQFSL